MNYKGVYDRLITRAVSENRKKHKKTDENYICYEQHHIVPKALGGNDMKENLVLLTPREHLIAHLCLVKMHPLSHAMIKAAMLMGTDRFGNRLNNRQYEWVRKQCALAPSPSKGKVSKRKGRTFGTNAAKGKPNGKKGIATGRSPGNKGLPSPWKGIPNELRSKRTNNE